MKKIIKISSTCKTFQEEKAAFEITAPVVHQEAESNNYIQTNEEYIVMLDLEKLYTSHHNVCNVTYSHKYY